MNYLMRIANPYITQCRIANPTQRPALRTSPRTEKVRMCIFIIMAIAWPRYLACVLWELPDVVGVASK